MQVIWIINISEFYTYFMCSLAYVSVL